MHPGDLSTHLFILDPMPGLPVILHNLPRPATTLRIYLVKNHVPFFGYAYMVLFYDFGCVLPPDQTGQKRYEIAFYGRIYRAFYYVCPDGP